MGYAVYEDQTARDYGVERWAGYGVPAICDFPKCSAEIDRGMGYRCEDYHVYRHFNEDGEQCSGDEDWVDERWEEEEGCGLHFCGEHSEHERHKDSTPKPDTPEWLEWMLTSKSWQQWRDLNPERVQAYRTKSGEEGND